MFAARLFLRIFTVLVAAVSMLVGLSAGQVQATAVQMDNTRPGDIQTCGLESDVTQARSAYDSQTGKINFIGTESGRPIQPPGTLSISATPERAARGYLSECGYLFGLTDQKAELIVKRQNQASGGRTVVKFQQVYQGIPIFAGELVLQLDASKNIILVNGEILPDIRVDTNASFDAASARQKALQMVAEKYTLDAEALKVSEPQLWIYNPMLIQPVRGITQLVWRMEVTSVELAPIRELVLVSARHGSVVLDFNQVDTFKNRQTYTANNTKALSGSSLVCDESNPTCSGGDMDAVNAHVYTGDTYDFYASYHDRDSIDNASMTMVSTVHYDTGYCNAFWNGAQMAYGDGCFMVADDVVGHEMTHGVTEYESDLVYAYAPGAINESFSDIWGEFIDLTNGKGTDTSAVRWLMGEDTSNGAVRSMKDPRIYADPDRMSSPYFYHGNNDNGGVHTNSGLGNKAAYLITDGDTFNGYTVTGIGITKTAKIFYEAQTNILTSGSNYHALYNALNQACNNLIGTSEITAEDCTQVLHATQATEMNMPYTYWIYLPLAIR